MPPGAGIMVLNTPMKRTFSLVTPSTRDINSPGYLRGGMRPQPHEGFFGGGYNAINDIWTEGSNILRVATPYDNLIGAVFGSPPMLPVVNQSPVMALEDWQQRQDRLNRELRNRGDGPGGGGRW